MAHWGKAECIRQASYRHLANMSSLLTHKYWKDSNIKLMLHVFIILIVNCVDRHAIKYPNRVALIWEKDKPGETEQVTYK